MIERTSRYIIYPPGVVVKFNPFLQWRFGDGTAEVWTRHYWGIGVHWKWTIGTFSRIKIRFVRLGRFTLYVRYGYTEKPYNPQTGEYYGDQEPK